MITIMPSLQPHPQHDLCCDVTRIDYVAPNGHIVDGVQGFASIVIEPRPDGDGTRTLFKNVNRRPTWTPPRLDSKRLEQKRNC